MSIDRMRILLVVLLSCLVGASACDPSPRTVVGNWIEVVGDNRLEFFSDGRVSMEGSRGIVVANWALLDDGRVKIEGGETPLSLGRFRGDTLTFDERDPSIWGFVRLTAEADTISADQREEMRRMRDAFVHLDLAQQVYFLGHRRYASLGQLTQDTYVMLYGHSMKSLAGTRSGWKATIRHAEKRVECTREWSDGGFVGPADCHTTRD